jgi:hypothetical protein
LDLPPAFFYAPSLGDSISRLTPAARLGASMLDKGFGWRP